MEKSDRTPVFSAKTNQSLWQTKFPMQEALASTTKSHVCVKKRQIEEAYYSDAALEWLRRSSGGCAASRRLRRLCDRL